MQPGGQYGVPPHEVQSQYGVQARGTSASATGSTSHTAHQLFSLEVTGSGLALSTSASSISHHHNQTQYSLGQTHHQSSPQSAGIHTQPYFIFQDHLQAQHHHHHHHHHQQSLQSPASTQQHQQLDHPTPSISGQHHAQFQQQSVQKQGSMVPSISVLQHAGQDQGALLQHYAHQQQHHHHLNLGLDSPIKPVVSSSMQQQQVSRSQQLSPAAAPTGMATSSATLATLNTSSSIGFNTPTTEISAAATTVLAPVTAVPISALNTTSFSMNNASSAGTVPVATIDLQQELVSNKTEAENNMARADQGGNIEDVDVIGDEGDKAGSGGNRWPRQETLALLRVRSEMDVAFRDSSLKRPLWDEVSRKLAELGFQRSAKKCKEKFENVHKYYKRTKEGKAGRQDGKNYRFFSELEALYGNSAGQNTNSNVSLTTGAIGDNTGSFAASAGIFSLHARSGLGSDDYLGSPPHLTSSSNPAKSSFSLLAHALGGSAPVRTPTRPQLVADTNALHFSDSDTSSASEDDNKDDEYEDPSDNTTPDHSKKRKRKSMHRRMMAFFENLLKQVMDKQEQMQQRFLEALERREQDRMIREEAWKRQEMARLSREHDLQAQERSLAAARDAAIVAFIQKMTGQTFQLPTSNALVVAAQPVQSQAPILSSSFDTPTIYQHVSEDQDPFDPTSKRWPKGEVLALIKLRTNLHARFCEPGPKGPLWEDIANGMSRLGYNRNAKRCKEKWENINKYFKKAKESNKNRPENAKTCPYYHQLDALYKQGVLGSGGVSLAVSNIKALPYKSESTAMDATNSLQAHDQAPAQHAAEQVLAPPASQMSTASEATASTGNAINMSAGGGSMMSNDMNIQPMGVDHTTGVDGDKQDTKVAPEDTSRVGVSENMVRPGTSSGLMQMQRQNLNQGYMERKVDLEQEARLVEDHQEHGRFQEQQVNVMQHVSKMQQHQQDIRPPPSAFMITTVLPKFNTSASDVPAESNTSTT